MQTTINENQQNILEDTVNDLFKDFDVIKIDKSLSLEESNNNYLLLYSFLSAKQVEGCSERTLIYYQSTLIKMFDNIKKNIGHITTDDLRMYLYEYKKINRASKATVDNIRRVLSSFFSWLEDEGYILKNPVRRIHKIKTRKVVKEVLSDENFEVLRDNCSNIRDLAMIELLASTGYV